jgi:hypothetical protein
MQRWLTLIFLMGVFVFPQSASAQIPLRLSSLEVQLWPEYDQPSMLVIYDFELPDSVTLPIDLSLRIPQAANLTAVAYQAPDGQQLYANYAGPTASDAWQTVTVHIQTQAIYHAEYYQPLSRSGSHREFSFLWAGDYAVDDFGISLRTPVDSRNMITKPVMESVQGADGAAYLKKKFDALGAGQQFPLQVSYDKTSDALSASQQELKPSQPLGANTPGRVMLSNYLPYMFGVLGAVLVVGGLVYFWQSTRSRRSTGEKRHRPSGQRGSRGTSEAHCHQCGTRTRSGDRFCRVCGTKLRPPV